MHDRGPKHGGTLVRDTLTVAIHMHISFDVEPQWLIFAAGLVFGSAAATAIAYVFLRQHFVPTQTPPSKPKASRWAEYASRGIFAHISFILSGSPVRQRSSVASLPP